MAELLDNVSSPVEVEAPSFALCSQDCFDATEAQREPGAQIIPLLGAHIAHANQHNNNTLITGADHGANYGVHDMPRIHGIKLQRDTGCMADNGNSKKQSGIFMQSAPVAELLPGQRPAFASCDSCTSAMPRRGPWFVDLS